MIIILVFPVFALLSYRLDPMSVYKDHSEYKYDSELKDEYLGLWIAHKVLMWVWSVLINLHILMLCFVHPASSRITKLLHIISGSTIIVVATAGITIGLVMLSEKQARYNAFTLGFFVFAAGINYLAIIALLLSVPVFKDCMPRIVVFGYELSHHHPGFLLMFSPVGMLIQFITYTLLILNDRDDYVSWQVSLWFNVAFAILLAGCLHVVIFILVKSDRISDGDFLLTTK